jgi:hypothetical protein
MTRPTPCHPCAQLLLSAKRQHLGRKLAKLLPWLGIMAISEVKPT